MKGTDGVDGVVGYTAEVLIHRFSFRVRNSGNVFQHAHRARNGSRRHVFEALNAVDTHVVTAERTRDDDTPTRGTPAISRNILEAIAMEVVRGVV